jgi:hypothetical protein
MGTSTQSAEHGTQQRHGGEAKDHTAPIAVINVLTHGVKHLLMLETAISDGSCVRCRR